MARVLLISYPGYPATPAHLVANPWLAGQAGALAATGHEVLALDFGTVSMMRRLYPEALTNQLKPLAAGMMGGGGSQIDEQGLRMLQDLDAMLVGHQERVVEELAEELAAQVADHRPQLIMFEIGDGDGFMGTVQIAERLQGQFPELLIGAGGRKAAWFRGLIFKRVSAFDAVVFGDPEEAVVRLAQVSEGKADLRQVPGVAIAADVEIAADDSGDLDDLPLPLYDKAVYPAMAGDEKIKMAILTESRGCNNRCAFCLHPWEDGARQRLCSSGKIVDTMQALQELYGMSTFRFGGASTPGDLMYDVAQEIIRRDLKMQYNSFGHFRSANPDHFEVMAKSGLYSLFFGLESGCQEILDKAVHKGIKLEKVQETMQAAQAAGIFAAASVIVPLPFDTEATLAESLSFLTELKPDSAPLQFPGLMPGTRWIADPTKYQIEVDDVETFLLDGLSYRFKQLFPPQFWEPLPYKVNGMGFHEFTGQTIKFAGQLEAAGILTNFSHTLASIAKAAEMPARQLRDAAQLWCVTGDAEAMGAMVARANQAMCQSS
ncbi:MAG: B12-binding domain-containing radical SAM protein [Armatimonadota bacterium]